MTTKIIVQRLYCKVFTLKNVAIVQDYIVFTLFDIKKKKKRTQKIKSLKRIWLNQQKLIVNILCKNIVYL